MFAFEFCGEVNREETSQCSEDRMIIAGVVFSTISACDGRTVRRSDGQTESIMANTALC